jgi:hypothetical protein
MTKKFKKHVFVIKDEFVFRSDSKGVYNKEESQTDTTYIAKEEYSLYKGKRKRSFALYQIQDRKAKPKLVVRYNSKKAMKRSFEENTAKGLLKRKYYYKDSRPSSYAKGDVTVITTDHTRVIKGSGGNYRYPQMVAKVEINDNKNQYESEVFVAYATQLNRLKPTMSDIVRSKEECIEMAVARFKTFHNIKMQTGEKSGDPRGRYFGRILSYRWQYWKSQGSS